MRTWAGWWRACKCVLLMYACICAAPFLQGRHRRSRSHAESDAGLPFSSPHGLDKCLPYALLGAVIRSFTLTGQREGRRNREEKEREKERDRRECVREREREREKERERKAALYRECQQTHSFRMFSWFLFCSIVPVNCRQVVVDLRCGRTVSGC